MTALAAVIVALIILAILAGVIYGLGLLFDALLDIFVRSPYQRKGKR